MALKTTVRLGGDPGSTTWDATTQVALYEGDGTPLLAAGMRCDNGSACQYTITVEDRTGEISRGDLTKGFGSHNVITISENASGTERWIGRGRVSGVEAGRDGKYWPATKTLVVTVDDGNVDLRGLTLTSTWSRGAESGRARVLAALSAFCNGSPRLTTVIATHLVASGGEVTMPAKDYLAGTELNEIFTDCAGTEGKNFSVVIHHSGGSHLCFLYIDDQDHTTYLSTLSISDVPSEVNNTTVFAPHWLQGPAFWSDEGDVLSGIVSRFGSAPEQFAYFNDTAAITAGDYWVNPYNDSLSENYTQAAARAAFIRDNRILSHVSHTPTLRMKAEYVHLIEAGMSISIKSAAAMGGQYLNTAQTRRIAQAKKEPIAPQLVNGETGWYYVHLQLDRPIGIIPSVKGLPVGPQPAGSSLPNVVSYGLGGTSAGPIVVPDDLTNSALVVFGCWDGANVPFTATYGSAMTPITGSQVVNGRTGIRAFYLLNPPADPTGTGTVLSVQDSVTAQADKTWFVLENVNQTTPIGTVVTATGTSTSAAPGAVTGTGVPLATAYLFVLGSPHAPSPVADATQVQTASATLIGGIGHRDIGAGYGDTTPTFTLSASEAWAAVGLMIQGVGSSPEPVDDTGDVGTDSGQYANADHVHAHGTYTSGDYHEEYVREAILTTAGDMPYATGASTWTRVPIGSSNFHMRSDGTKPVWSPESSGLTNPMTTAGDIIVGGASGTPARLAIGASNTILKSDGTTPVYANTARLSYIDLDVHTPNNPPTPPAGVIRLYGSNSRAFAKNESGTAFDLTETGSGSGGGGGGAPTTAKYLVTAYDAGLSAEVSIPVFQGDPRVAPSSAGSGDDEFDTTDTGNPPTGWTNLSSAGFTTSNINSTYASMLRVTKSATSTGNLFGFYKAKSPAFTVTVRMAAHTLRANFGRAGIFIGEGTPGKIETMDMVYNSAYQWEVMAWTNPTTFSATVGSNINAADGTAFTGLWHGPYFRIIVASSTDVTYQYSQDGYIWRTHTASRNPGFTVGSVGFFAEPLNASTDIEAVFDFIRFT